LYPISEVASSPNFSTYEDNFLVFVRTSLRYLGFSIWMEECRAGLLIACFKMHVRHIRYHSQDHILLIFRGV